MNHAHGLAKRRRGHVRKLASGRFQALVYAGIDPVTGRQRYLSETHPNEAAAERARVRLLAQVDTDRTPNTGATLGFLLDRWLAVADLEVSTRHTYQLYIQTKITPRLGSLPLRKLGVDTLDRFYAYLCREGGIRYARTADGTLVRDAQGKDKGTGADGGVDHPPGSLHPAGRADLGDAVGLDGPQPRRAGHPAAGRARPSRTRPTRPMSPACWRPPGHAIRTSAPSCGWPR